jgi:CubicO group peptidase (beta-lactamase class C family)
VIRASTFALAGAAALSGCVHKALPVPDHARVQAIVADTGFGGAIVLGRAGEVVYAHGFGEADRERGLPFTPATAGDGGSIAKTFAAAAIHLLVAEGRLGLDDPVASHVPEFPHGATRVRHLLVHSVGLPDYDFFDADLPPGTRRDAASMLRVLANRQSAPSFAPGSRFEYSSLGYDVAALVVERVSGQPYTRFVQDRLLAPLGLRDSFPRPAFFADWPGPRTLGYRDRDGRWSASTSSTGKTSTAARTGTSRPWT